MEAIRKKRMEPAKRETADRPGLRFRFKGDFGIFICTLILTVFGSIMVISTAHGMTLDDGTLITTRTLLYETAKQGAFAVIAIGLMWILKKGFTYRRAAMLIKPMLWIYIGLLAAVQLIGVDRGGSKAWLQVFRGITIQPSEFGKPLLIVFLAAAAWSAYQNPKLRKSFWTYFRYPLILMTVSFFALFFLQKDLGSLVITMLIGFTGMLVPKYRSLQKVQKVLAGLLIAGVIALALVMIFSDEIAALLRRIPHFGYVAVRIENAADPYLNIHDSGYQPANALYAISDAGFFGKGLGASVRKYGFLTQAESDYILAVVIEETGMLGLCTITICYSYIIMRLIYWSTRTNQTADQVLFTCTAAYLTFHFFINVAGVASLIPMTGVPLLFISKGGSSLLAVFMTLGAAQSRIKFLADREEDPDSQENV